MADIRINFNKRTGKIKPLHGVNNGPVGYGTFLNVSNYYKELGIPHVRLHDANWPNTKEVDIPQIFRNFDADPKNPESYDFRRTDEYVKSVIETGAQIVYRLGTSIEHTKIKYHTNPPKDFHKWAEICIGIIKHYNQGWADGFHYNIKYWEIWNEPDDLDGSYSMWAGTSEQYYRLYKTASIAIKNFDQGLKVGGFGATMQREDFLIGFFEYCKKEELPLDFFSWHIYTNNPSSIADVALKVRILADSHGYSKAEMHLNEWNYSPEGGEKLWRREAKGKYIEEYFQKFKNEEGASFCAATLICLQSLPVDVANYYDGQAFSWLCGLFSLYGAPQKTFYAFKAFKELYDLKIMVETEITSGNEGIYCCSSITEAGEEACILLSNFNTVACEVNLQISGLSGQGEYVMEKYDINKERSFELTASHIIKNSGTKFDIFMNNYSVILYKIKKINSTGGVFVKRKELK